MDFIMMIVVGLLLASPVLFYYLKLKQFATINAVVVVIFLITWALMLNAIDVGTILPTIIWPASIVGMLLFFTIAFGLFIKHVFATPTKHISLIGVFAAAVTLLAVTIMHGDSSTLLDYSLRVFVPLFVGTCLLTSLFQKRLLTI
ncbi:hypothetical protein FLK61_24965 [Paenalkalicoccus suaedae]|uniref:Uncharacterized protein n=1 Tax=Paenalkalicoccus suaedae TaxID=2592382 RepID=A0A859FAP3_9BACI|nr:hypothetical protein [Paenalkalicoccus suaedae]QKS70027.1 hypothetical protein FLK61_24965 [Paenalkalicoccus suaedae]